MMRWRRALRDARLDRAIERELTTGLSPRRRAALHARLREDPRARARYDRAVLALRVLEGDVDVAPSELDVVGRWLMGERGQPEPAAAPRRAWSVALAGLVAALVLLWLSPLRDPGALRPWADDGWRSRGGGPEGLALEVLCGPDDADPAARRVQARDCDLSELMGLAYRVPEGVAGQLTVFGVDGRGEVMFYVPTPASAAGVAVEPGRWRPLSLAVRLRTNHAPGPLRIYGLVAPTTATVAEVEAFAAQLAARPAAAFGEAPWIDRVAPASLVRLCPERAGSCTAAELHLTLAPKASP